MKMETVVITQWDDGIHYTAESEKAEELMRWQPLQ